MNTKFYTKDTPEYKKVYNGIDHVKGIILESNYDSFDKLADKKLELFYDYFKSFIRFNKIIIAGGAVSSALSNKKINDIDIYIVPETKYEGYILLKKDIEHFLSRFKGMFIRTDYAITIKNALRFNNETYDIQIILVEDHVEDIINSFDIDVCRCYYDGKYHMTLDCLTAIKTKCITVDISKNSSSFANRLSKYFKRGFALKFGPEVKYGEVNKRTAYNGESYLVGCLDPNYHDFTKKHGLMKIYNSVNDIASYNDIGYFYTDNEEKLLEMWKKTETKFFIFSTDYRDILNGMFSMKYILQTGVTGLKDIRFLNVQQKVQFLINYSKSRISEEEKNDWFCYKD